MLSGVNSSISCHSDVQHSQNENTSFANRAGIIHENVGIFLLNFEQFSTLPQAVSEGWAVSLAWDSLSEASLRRAIEQGIGNHR